MGTLPAAAAFFLSLPYTWKRNLDSSAHRSPDERSTLPFSGEIFRHFAVRMLRLQSKYFVSNKNIDRVKSSSTLLPVFLPRNPIQAVCLGGGHLSGLAAPTVTTIEVMRVYLPSSLHSFQFKTTWNSIQFIEMSSGSRSSPRPTSNCRQ